MYIVAISTTGWSIDSNLDTKLGLWRSCIGSYCFSTVGGKQQGWYRSSQITSGIGLPFFIFGTVAAFVYAFVDLNPVKKGYALTACNVCCGVAFGLTLSCIINYGVNVKHNLNYSYYLAVIVDVLAV